MSEYDEIDDEQTNSPTADDFKTLRADAKKARKLAEDLELPAGTLVVVLDRKRKWLRRALKKVPDSDVYRRRL